jgi:hypothetical protein
VYLCEDTHTSYHSDHGGGLRKPETFIEFAKARIDWLHSCVPTFALGGLATSAPQKPTPHLHRDRRHICTGTCRRYHWRDATTAAERDAARAFRNEVLGIHFYEGVVVVEKEPNEHPCFPSQICGPSNTAQYSTQTGTPA